MNINVKNNEISVENNGKGIPIEIHKDHNIFWKIHKLYMPLLSNELVELKFIQQEEQLI